MAPPAGTRSCTSRAAGAPCRRSAARSRSRRRSALPGWRRCRRCCLGGPAPYWQSWAYDTAGDRLTQVDHATPGGTGNGDSTTSYAYPAAGQPQPHALQQATTADAGGSHTRSYGYDPDGDTTRRPGTAGTQQLAWDAEGNLASVTDGAATTSFVYDADGSRLIRHDATGATLYLPGTELRLASSTGQVSATRYYSHAGRAVAMRTTAGLTWLFSDHHATPDLAVDATTQSATQRRQTPFGTPRGSGSQAAWPGERGFVGGTSDPDGLTHLGARDYDPAIGRFVSVDPEIDPADPQQLQGYAYAGNTPVTASDPTGLMAECECNGARLEDYAGTYPGFPAPIQTPSPSPSGPRYVPTSPSSPRSIDPRQLIGQAGALVQKGIHAADRGIKSIESAADEKRRQVEAIARAAAQLPETASKGWRGWIPQQQAKLLQQAKQLRQSWVVTTADKFSHGRAGRLVKAAPGVGFALSAVGHYGDGDRVFTAVAKAGIEQAFSVAGEAAGGLAVGAVVAVVAFVPPLMPVAVAAFPFAVGAGAFAGSIAGYEYGSHVTEENSKAIAADADPLEDRFLAWASNPQPPTFPAAAPLLPLRG